MWCAFVRRYFVWIPVKAGLDYNAMLLLLAPASGWLPIPAAWLAASLNIEIEQILCRG